jgi:hypothetical protein
MKSNRWIDSSRRVYAWLLGLYPREYSAEYGESMLQVFTDQCRAAHQENRPFGLFTLWVRTFFDLGKTAIHEHLTSPHAKQGLLEAAPGKPLPWKGVAVLLIPGLIFLVGQISQLTDTGWFWILTSKASYFLMIPVMLVWWKAKKFPVWGLVPLGLLVKNLFDLVYRVQIGGVNTSNPLWQTIEPAITWFQDAEYAWITTGFLVFIIVILWKYICRRSVPGIVWLLLGLYGLISLVQIGMNLWVSGTEYTLLIMFRDQGTLWLVGLFMLLSIFVLQRYSQQNHIPRSIRILLSLYVLFSVLQIILEILFTYRNQVNILSDKYNLDQAPLWKVLVLSGAYRPLFDTLLDSIYSAIGFLFLIWISLLFVRRHSNLAILLLFGYKLSTVVVGTAYMPDILHEMLLLGYSKFAFDAASLYPYLALPIAMTYRLVICILAPVLIVRSNGQRVHNRIIFAMASIVLTLQLFGGLLNSMYLFSGKWFTYLFDYANLSPVLAVTNVLLAAIGFGLAWTLYRQTEKEPAGITENKKLSPATS